MDTITFTNSDGNCTLTVLTGFMQKHPDVQNNTMYDLVTKYHIDKYLHCTIGPALIDHWAGTEEYFLNGKQMTRDAIEEVELNTNFNNKLEDLLK